MRSALFLVYVFSAFAGFSQITLNPCVENTPVTVVVLGSSTAAGAGPSHSDSTWVNRYRKTLQAINPANQVINLAVGGFNTYRIMPDGFVPTISGRPTIDSAHNISEGLRYNPDVIIINLPSNDRGFPREEQLANFDSLYRFSNNQGVPMYLCTTQPIGAPSWAPYQRAVRDSIVKYYPNNFIEFFLPFADSSGVLLPLYDSGDGIHMSDAGHHLLWQQVVQKDFLKDIVPPKNGVDLAISKFYLPGGTCIDSKDSIAVLIANLGQNVIPGPIGTFEISFSGTTQSHVLALSNKWLNSCEVDTVWFPLAINQGAKLKIKAQISALVDSFPSNNFLEKVYDFELKPNISAFTKPSCDSLGGKVVANSSDADTLIWYQDPRFSMPFYPTGDSLSGLQKDSVFWVQPIKGPFHYSGIVSGASQTNISWDGFMFDLVPTDTVFIDSLSFLSADSGWVSLNIYTAQQSHRGIDSNANAWQLFSNVSVFSSATQSMVIVPFNYGQYNPGDTLAVYLEMQSGKKLRYQSASQPSVFKSAAMDMISGTGKSPNFGNSYYPRSLAGQVFYHYGYNPQGSCAGEVVEVKFKSNPDSIPAPLVFKYYLPAFSGNDTIPGTQGYASYWWVDVHSGDTLSRDSIVWYNPQILPQYQDGDTLRLLLWVLDENGCKISTQILVIFIEPFHIEESAFDFNVYPNPAQTNVNISFAGECEIRLVNSVGVEVVSKPPQRENATIVISHLPPGIYLVKVKNEKGDIGMKKLVVR